MSGPMDVRPPRPAAGEPGFSLVTGGALYRLYLRAHLARQPLGFLGRRMIVLPLIAWLPLLVLSLIDRSALPGSVDLPFLQDVATNLKLLVVLPLMIAAELVAQVWLQPMVEQFVRRGIVPEEEVPKFRDAIASALRLRDSVLAEVILLVLVYLLAGYVWREQFRIQGHAWFGTMTDPKIHLAPAGYWYRFVAAPLLHFIQIRWLYRIFIWWRFLRRVSRLKLHLVPSHPDRVGGLGFLGMSLSAFGVFALAQGASISAGIAGNIFNEGAKLPTFKIEIVVGVILILFVIVGPLLAFSRRLRRTKRVGLIQYGELASRYVEEFDRKWVQGRAPKDEPLVGSSDIQSLADLANSFSVVDGMKAMPFTRNQVIALALATIGPLLPLILTMVPLAELLKKLARLVM